ncbi:unnamed protein product [Dracunculus medinensis]|uniref:Helicase ATP-binding domain-containing protein n=1 Tax=Dracunculus medinensis TaxID=318479 RepID=A0A3P7PS66_DRAME|nr:unnamed protein product [Dracunculus medinensis]
MPFVFDALASCEKIGVSFGASTYCLPEGTKRFSGLYEEITVPGFDNSIVKNIEQINVKDMDELGQKGFQNYVKLNVVQSLVFEQTYKTKENLLVCAPTGAGKTNIAMLAILNTIHEHTFKSQILKDEFKIIYLAPMKALAAEMTETFGKRLSIFGLKVRELTGDTVLSKSEIVNTQMLVLTPEKWDVITRKPGVSSLESLVRLMIIDEVHLLHDSRGAVIEAIVARCFRQIEMSQKSVRIIGLSATLPNYMDVARFLKVNPQKGLFFFDGRFRPVPLTQTFIGVPRTSSSQSINSNMDEVCFIKAHEFCRNGHQILIFVHSRNGTSKLALILKAMASDRGVLRDFVALNSTEKNQSMGKKLAHSIRNKLLYDLVQYGFGIHHAGLARHDRNIIEKLFTKGYIKVLVCTATLAWGVNLPAHAVIIKGTDVFDSQRGTMCDLGVLDVQQIFGRAGRPQYEETGHGVIITWKDKMAKYIEMLTRQAPIESQFQSRLYDNLNAEIALGTVSSIGEAVEWLSYTYFFIRANKNPLAYGITYAQLRDDPNLSRFLSKLVMDAAEKLDMNQMIRYDSLNGFVSSTDLGRIASNFYIKFETIEMLNTSCGPCRFTSVVTDETILLLIANASEFSQMKVRNGF